MSIEHRPSFKSEQPNEQEEGVDREKFESAEAAVRETQEREDALREEGGEAFEKAQRANEVATTELYLLMLPDQIRGLREEIQIREDSTEQQKLLTELEEMLENYRALREVHMAIGIENYIETGGE